MEFPQRKRAVVRFTGRPGETHNLSEDAAYQNKLSELRKMMVEHLSERGDSFVKDGKLMTLDTTLLYSPNFPK